MMKELDVNDIKRISLEILCDVDKFCFEKGLEYFLGYGTLLGAVRHKGYIPWDDDIDIIMPRPDYECFIREYPLYSERYIVYVLGKDRYYHLPFAKVADSETTKKEGIDFGRSIRGVEIDIFPLDGLSNSIDNANKIDERVHKLLIMRNLSSYRDHKAANVLNALGKRVVGIYAKIRGLSYWLNRINNVAQTYSYTDSKYVGNIVIQDYYGKQIMDKSYYSESVKIEFEGKYFNAPKGYSEVLAQTFGDYMKLPPVEKQITHHDYVAYQKD